MEKFHLKKLIARAAVGAGVVAALCFGVPAMADEEISAVAQTENPVSVAAENSSQETQNGWVTNKKGWKKYYRNGKYLTGRHKVHGKYYYFGAKSGYMKKSVWVTVNGKKFYFGWKGVGCTGLTKIRQKWYLFSQYGAMRTSKTTIGNTTYYIKTDGTVEAYQKGGKYYLPSGKKMDSVSAANFETLQYAKAIVSQITTPDMSQSYKRLVCFNWVIKHYYRTTHVYTKQENWPSLYANDYLKGGMYGSCFSDSCAFAFLAKAIGYQNVNICVDTTGTQNAHCFVEIDGLYYDPLFAEAKSFSRNYAAPAGVYALSPMVKVAL